MDVLSRRRHEAGKIFSAIQKYDWKIKIGPLVIALAQFLPVARLGELLDFATTKDLISAKDLANLYVVLYKRTSDISYLRKAFRVYLDVDEDKALEVLRSYSPLATTLEVSIATWRVSRVLAGLTSLLFLISEAVKRKDIDFAKEVLLEKEGHTLTVKQAQALGRELGSKISKGCFGTAKRIAW